MKKILGAASAAAAAAACIAVGTAGTAFADPELNGTYTLTVDETQATTNQFLMKNPEVETKQWIVTSCGPGCANVTIPDNPNGGGQLKLVNGRWEMSKDTTLMNCNPASLTSR